MQFHQNHTSGWIAKSIDPFPLYTDGTSYPHNDKTSSWLVDGHVKTLRLEEIRNYRYNYVLATEK